MLNGKNVPNAKVMRVGIDDIQYRVGERAVVYTVRKADVAKIVYSDGTEDIFAESATAAPVQPAAATEAPQHAADPSQAHTPPEKASGGATATAVAIAEAVLFKPKKIPISSPDPQAILNALKDTRPGDTIAVTIPIPAQMGMGAKMLKPKDIVVPLYGTTVKEIGKALTDAKPKPGDTVKFVIPTLSEIAGGMATKTGGAQEIAHGGSGDATTPVERFEAATRAVKEAEAEAKAAKKALRAANWEDDVDTAKVADAKARSKVAKENLEKAKAELEAATAALEAAGMEVETEETLAEGGTQYIWGLGIILTVVVIIMIAVL
jgi:hypothetical protein